MRYLVWLLYARPGLAFLGALVWGIIELVLDVVFDWWDGVQLRQVARRRMACRRDEAR